MALSVADNLRRCIERFGSTVANPARSRAMMQRPLTRRVVPSAQAKVEPDREETAAKPLPPAAE